jgi:thymidylate synthase
MNINEIRNVFRNKLQKREFIDNTIEIINANFIVDEPTIFGELNEDYAARELAWYKTMSLNVNDIPPPIPRIWLKVANDEGYINSNYGWAVYHEDNCSQLEHVYYELASNPTSRRGLAIYTRPSMWKDYQKDGIEDFMCTNNFHYLIRNNKLDAIVNMRSNDAVFGFKNDAFWQKYVQKELADRLRIEVGTLYWQANSLHVYDRHYHLVEQYEEMAQSIPYVSV